MTDEEIKRFMGHRDIETTRKYCSYPIESNEKIKTKAEEVLGGSQKSGTPWNTKVVSFLDYKKIENPRKHGLSATHLEGFEPPTHGTGNHCSIP